MRLDPCALSNNTDPNEADPPTRQQQGNGDMTTDLQVVPARRGRAIRLAKGQAIQIINTHGQQVVDTWCFNADDLSEFMSMEPLHASLQGIFPATGDGLARNRRRPILVLEEDTSPGRHDTIIAACDVHRYAELGCRDYHDNCTDNLHAALGQLGRLPCPAEPVDEHSRWPRRQDRLGRAAEQARGLRDAARHDGLHRCHVNLPAGHDPNQQRGVPADRGSLSADGLIGYKTSAESGQPGVDPIDPRAVALFRRGHDQSQLLAQRPRHCAT